MRVRRGRKAENDRKFLRASQTGYYADFLSLTPVVALIISTFRRLLKSIQL